MEFGIPHRVAVQSSRHRTRAVRALQFNVEGVFLLFTYTCVSRECSRIKMDTGGDTFHSFQCKIGGGFFFFCFLLF